MVAMQDTTVAETQPVFQDGPWTCPDKAANIIDGSGVLPQDEYVTSSNIVLNEADEPTSPGSLCKKEQSSCFPNNSSAESGEVDERDTSLSPHRLKENVPTASSMECPVTSNGAIDENTYDSDERERLDGDMSIFEKFAEWKEYPKRRRSSIIATPAAPLPSKSKSKAAVRVGWCVLCERPISEEYDQHLDVSGGVTCQNYKCQRSFHIACLNDMGIKDVDPDTFICSPCTKSQVLCPECHQGVDREESVICPQRSCHKRYHAYCWKWDNRPCPFHACRKCVERNVDCGSQEFLLSHDRYSCVRCATCYHVSCIPKTCVRLDLGPSQSHKFVCDRHEVFPNSIRWRPPLLIPLWVGVSTLKELPFSLSPDWLNGTSVDDEEIVIIRPEALFYTRAEVIKTPQKKAVQAAKRKPTVAHSKKRVEVKVKPKASEKVEKLDVSAVVKLDHHVPFFDNLDFVPEFSLEPPPGFVMEPYRTRSRNVYVVPRKNSREGAHVCACLPATKCANDSCVNRSLQIECDARFCPCGEDCQNQRLQKREWQPMRLIFTKDRGCGMMSLIPITAGSLVIEYVGEVLDEFTFRLRIQENTEKKRPQDNYYMMQLTRHLVIDARKTGNNARFLNHSCSPNCRTEIWEVAKGELRAGIFAIYDIPAGVELTYDYNFELFSKAVNSESVPCRCGAKNCSKFLGVRPLRLSSKK